MMTSRADSALNGNFPKLGILGGGQLGKMLLVPAMNWHLPVSILDSSPDAPCSRWNQSFSLGNLNDYQTVIAFGADKDVLTIEIEHVNVEALATLEAQGKAVYPQPSILQIIQDKRLQKQFYKEKGIPTSPFLLTDQATPYDAYLPFLPGFHKAGKGGYDGKGVVFVKDKADLGKVFRIPSVIEKAVDISKEITVIVARSSTGEVVCYDPVELVYTSAHLVDYLIAPADLAEYEQVSARQLAMKVAEAFGIVGLLAVELFLDSSGQWLVNEVAPRPHNSGHHTIEASTTSQYEQHLRAILGLPLGATSLTSMAAMVNLVGEEGYTGKVHYKGLEVAFQLPGTSVHLYGKSETRPNRKMGHITILADSKEELLARLHQIRLNLRVRSQQ